MTYFARFIYFCIFIYHFSHHWISYQIDSFYQLCCTLWFGKTILQCRAGIDASQQSAGSAGPLGSRERTVGLGRGDVGRRSQTESVQLATYRGCPGKEDKDGQGHVTTEKFNPHFIMQYNENYCSRDLCNNKMNTDGDLKSSPGTNTAPKESGSNHCYAAITSDSKWNPKRVTCSKGYDRCYSGNASITVGGTISYIVIKTCSRPNFSESQNLSFGPIKFSLLGSSCLGSYCNGPKTDVTSHGKETVVTCWFSFFALSAISLGGALLY